jgi:hypothetical protein
MAEAGDTFQRYIRVGERVAQAALQRKTIQPERRQELNTLLSDVVKALLTERSVAAIESAWTHLDEEVAKFLLQELNLIASMHAGADAVDGTEDIKTGKESIEDILGDWLPGWLKHLLKILNEILKLVR